MGNHVIVRVDTLTGRGERLQGVFNDEQFFALPLVKQFGAFPSGYHAVHFGDVLPDHVAASRPLCQDDAVLVLKGVLKDCLKRKWMLRLDASRTLDVFPSRRAARAALRQFVAYWRWSGTAIPEAGYWKREETKVPERYLLRRRRQNATSTVATVEVLPASTQALSGWVEPTDGFSTSMIRDAVQNYRRFYKKEVAA